MQRHVNSQLQIPGQISLDDNDITGMREPSRRLKQIYEKTRTRVPVSGINTVLNTVVANLGLDRRLREHALMSMWPQIAGEQLANKSRGLFIDCEGNLVVSAADGSVAQELSLMKPQLLKQVARFAASLKVEVRGMRLDLKHYHRPPDDALPEAATDYLPASRPEDDADLMRIELTNEDALRIRCLQDELESQSQQASGAISAAIRERIVKVFEQELRIRRWRRQQNYPLCQWCGDPVPRLHTVKTAHDNVRICPACHYSNMQTGSNI